MHPLVWLKQRPDQVLQILLAVSSIGFAHWFFGNLYEAFVLTPNLLRLSVLAASSSTTSLGEI